MNQSGSFGRIFALLLRYLYLLRSSWPRIIEIAYWPTMQMVIWGFVSQHFSKASPELTAGGILISVVLIWDCLFRSHISYTLFSRGTLVTQFGQPFCLSTSSLGTYYIPCQHKYDADNYWNASSCIASNSFF